MTAVCGFLVNLSTAFADVIVDSMMVMQSRRDPVNGSERLQSFSWLCKASGGIIATVITSYMTEYLHPRWCFLFYSVLGLPVFFSGMCLNKQIDQEGLDEMSDSPLENVKKTLKEVAEVRKIPQILQVAAFLIISGILAPSFSTFWYYYNRGIKSFR